MGFSCFVYLLLNIFFYIYFNHQYLPNYHIEYLKFLNDYVFMQQYSAKLSNITCIELLHKTVNTASLKPQADSTEINIQKN